GVPAPLREREAGFGLRPRRIGRRHHSGPELADDLLPVGGIVADRVEIEPLEAQVRDALGVVVAIEAEAGEGGSMSVRRVFAARQQRYRRSDECTTSTGGPDATVRYLHRLPRR